MWRCSIVAAEFGDLFRAVEDEQMIKIIEEQNKSISDINSYYNSAAEIDESDLLQTSSYNTDNITADDVIATNANANNKLSPINELTKVFSINDEPISIKDSISNAIDKALSTITGGGFAVIGEIIESLRRKNETTNKNN